MNDRPQAYRATRATRVMIVDDHDLAREGLRGMLARERNLEVVGEAATGREAVALCRQVRPDLVLMDVRMPDIDGLAATRAIKEEFPTTSVLVITMQDDAEYLFEAVKAGAAGYLLKGSSRPEILAAVRRVIAGESLLDPDLAARLVARLAREAPPPAAASQVTLTARERDVLALIAQGYTNLAIANHLVIGLGTVKSHVEHIIRKLDASDRTQAVVRAIALGLITPTAE